MATAVGDHVKVAIAVEYKVDVVSLIDMGAARSLIRQDIWIKICNKVGRKSLIRKTNKRLHTLTGDWIEVAGKAVLTIYGKKVEVYIYKDLRHDLLLGDNALRTLCANVGMGMGF